MSNYEQEEYYPTDKVYETLGKSKYEDSYWHDNMNACLDTLNEKLGSPRLTNLHQLWYNGFEDLELKRLERSLLTVRIVVDDINREGKELRVWRVQHKHLKDLLCEADQVLDDIALRAPHLKHMFQSPQVTPHPYLSDKLERINNLIQELNNLAAEIKSMILPEFNTRSRKPPGPKIQTNVPSAISSHEPPVRNVYENLVAEIKSTILPEFNTCSRKPPGPKIQSNVPSAISSHEPPVRNIFENPPLAVSSYSTQGKNNHPFATPDSEDITQGKNNHTFATPDSDDITMYYSFSNPQGSVRSNEVLSKIDEDIIPHSYYSTSALKQEDIERKNHDTESMDSGKNRRTENVDTWKSRVTYNLNILEEPLISYEEKRATNIDDLPIHLKNCLLYISLFPKKYEFEKEIVVQMWIAVGYIQGEGKKLMEDTAGGYFEELLSMSLFEVSPLDASRYIIPDDVYNMIQESAEGEAEYARLEDGNINGISKRTLHSSVLHESPVDPMLFKSFNKLKGLHSLLFLHENRRYITQIPYDLMLSLGCIRVLDLSGMQLTELPSSVGNMKTLHYLDLSGNHIRSLPESIRFLSRLQVLRLRDCLSLVELPENMKNIINLRHLDLDIIQQLTFMPTRIGRLTKLQTLSAFIAGKEKGFQITELKNMNKLQGSLSIIKLENVGTWEEADEAALSDKEYLHNLAFQWSMPCTNAEEVLEGLQPNKNLTDLEIVCYGGSEFPAWLGDSSFSKLANLHIYNCKNAILLPLLGRLPSLEALRIAEMDTLVGIDEQFSQGSGSNMGFPKLEKLEFHGMHALEEWTGLPENGMPQLRTLTIVDCPNLVRLPELSNLKSLQHLEISFCFKLLSLGEEMLPPSLQRLIITDCPNLKEGYQKEAVEWHKIEDIPNIWIDYQQIF